MKKAKKPKLKKTKETLIKDVTIGDTLYKKGDSILLTEQGKKQFKIKNRIK